jgi:hypothetical protein
LDEALFEPRSEIMTHVKLVKLGVGMHQGALLAYLVLPSLEDLDIDSFGVWKEHVQDVYLLAHTEY